jgi:hypothetical protein
MPFYLYVCDNGHSFQRFSTISEHSPLAMCDCQALAKQVITAPVLVTCAADVCYDSPITGEPITSHHARLEDMKRHDCVEYDPEMKRDYERRIAEGDAKLDRLIDTHVEETIEKMPTATRAKLYRELTEQGVTAEPVRSTPTT